MREDLSLARFVLQAWPVVILATYAFRRRSAPVERTTAWLALLSVMFLPPLFALEAPGIYLGRDRIVVLSMWLALQLFHPELRAGASRAFPRLVLGVLVVGVMLTAYTNPEPLAYGRLVLPGLGLRDAVVMAAPSFIDYYVPFVIGLTVFRTERALRTLFDVLGLCALIYVPFCLVELRMSPQFTYWVYGYVPGSFIETKRLGSWRPVVFMNHGLSVAMFFFTTAVATLALNQARARVAAVSTRARAALIAAMVLASKSLGAWLYTLGAFAIRGFSSAKVVSRGALVLVALAVVYPIARTQEVFPTADIVGFASRISAERADSLEFRLRNEDQLIQRAALKPAFGWGYWGRGFIFSETGQYLSVTDGLWIIRLTSYGWVGLLAFYSLMVIPVVRFFHRRRQLSPTAQVLGSFLALIVASFAVDLLPNSLSDFLPLCYAGGLFGLTQRDRRPRDAMGRAASPGEAAQPPEEPGPV